MGVQTNVHQAVWKLLQTDIAFQKDLWRKVINTRALAKLLIDRHGLSASLDSVISAIRRFQGEEQFAEDEKMLSHVFSGAVISTRNNMACLTINIQVENFCSRLCKTSGSLPFRITSGKHGVKILVENPNLAAIKGLLSKAELVKVESDLSELSVDVSEQAVQTKGVLARIAAELALANINIREVIVVPPEFLLYVRQDDIVKAHESMLKLSRG